MQEETYLIIAMVITSDMNTNILHLFTLYLLFLISQLIIQSTSHLPTACVAVFMKF